MNVRFFSSSCKTVVIVALCVSSMCFNVNAASVASAKQPGNSTGNPAGALPPEGVYLAVDADYEWGELHNGSDGTASINGVIDKIKISNVSAVANLTWVPGWKVFGASYAMAIAQPYKWSDTEQDLASGTTVKDTADGTINTALVPYILSWDLGEGLFVSTSLVYTPDNGSDDEGRPFSTIEPGLAITKFSQTGWQYTANNAIDYNDEYTNSSGNKYQDGMTYYLDLTAVKTADKWTYGFIGNYTQQFTDDEQNGETVAATPGFNSKGNRAQHVLGGGMVAYNFGKFSLNTRLLYSLRAENDADVSFLHVGISLPIN